MVSKCINSTLIYDADLLDTIELISILRLFLNGFFTLAIVYFGYI